MLTEFTLRQRAIRLRLANCPIDTICQKLGRSRSWVRKWWQRFRDSGVDDLRERSQAPRHSPRRASDEVRAAIAAIRDRLTARRGAQARYRLAGAPTLMHYLAGLGYHPLPSPRQVERILQQRRRTDSAFRLAPEARHADYLAPPAPRSNQVHWVGAPAWLDDGSGPARVCFQSTTGLTRPSLERGQVMQVTGIVSEFTTSQSTAPGYRLLVRSAYDLAQLSPTEAAQTPAGTTRLRSDGGLWRAMPRRGLTR